MPDRIVEEELAVLREVSTRLEATVPAPPSAAAIVEERNAPVSRLFYAYRQGEAFEEEIAGRSRTGVLRARRTVTIRDRALQRVEAPEGIFQADPTEPDGWRRVEAETPRLAGGQGAAFRAHDIGAGAHRRLGAGVRRRADKHLPDIVGLIDPAQFELVSRPS
ncbi:MAG: hypothetical protein E6J83_17905, partial [Deltaproteobacteria bacterium]